MKEDIKILEERVNFCKNNKECREELKECFGCTFSARELSAIENIINHNKKLDIENQALFEAEVCGDTALLIKQLQKLKEEYEHLKEKTTRRKKEITVLIEKQKENKKTKHKLNSIKGEWKKFKRDIKRLEQELEKEKNKKLVSCHSQYVNCISKDEIRRKIEHYNGFKGLAMFEKYNYSEIILVLEELLQGG